MWRCLFTFCVQTWGPKMTTDSLLHYDLPRGTEQYQSLRAGLPRMHSSAAKTSLNALFGPSTSNPGGMLEIPGPVQHPSHPGCFPSFPAVIWAPRLSHLPTAPRKKEQLGRNQSMVLLCERPFKGPLIPASRKLLSTCC